MYDKSVSVNIKSGFKITRTAIGKGENEEEEEEEESRHGRVRA